MNMTKQNVNKYMNQTSQFDHAVGRKNLKQTLFSGLVLLGAALFFCFGQPASASTVSGCNWGATKSLSSNCPSCCRFVIAPATFASIRTPLK